MLCFVLNVRACRLLQGKSPLEITTSVGALNVCLFQCLSRTSVVTIKCKSRSVLSEAARTRVSRSTSSWRQLQRSCQKSCASEGLAEVSGLKANTPMKECVNFSVVQPAVLCGNVVKLSECRLKPAHRSAKTQLPNHLEFACSEVNR
jgi:hypothetical protein